MTSALGASDRIRLIKDIAAKLSQERWPLIDLTLQQFKLPWTDQWESGDTHLYVLKMIADAPDEKLLALAGHMGVDALGVRPTVEPAFWQSGEFRLFVTHLAKNKEQATELQTELRRFHIGCFVAHKDIEPTKEWQDEIELALSTADSLVALLTPGFHESKWTDQEIGFALGRAVLIVAVRLGEDPYGFLARHQALQGHGLGAPALAQKLFEIFLSNKQTQRQMTRALVAGLESSSSFAEAKSITSLLETTPYWETGFDDRVRGAVRDNRQVSEAFGVPERIEALIAKQTPF